MRIGRWATALLASAIVASMGAPTAAQTESDSGLIAYWHLVRGASLLCVADPTTTETRVLLESTDRRYTQPDWSPDGRSLAVESDGEIFLLNADGSDLRSIGPGTHPSWSPDGTRIMFAGSDGIYVMDADGGNRTRIIESGQSPDWSPDGTQFVFNRPPDPQPTDGPEGDLHTAAIDGSEVEEIGQGTNPDWSPDGSRIVHGSGTYWSRGIAVVNADGTERQPLSPAGGTGSDLGWPDWSPDGSKIAYFHSASVDTSIWIVRVDGGAPRHITRGREPSWGATTLRIEDFRDRPRCIDPRHRVTARLHGHLFVSGRLTSVGPGSCRTDGVTIEAFRKRPDGSARSAGYEATDAAGRFSFELRVQRHGRLFKSDRPGLYKFGSHSGGGCKGDWTHYLRHRH